MAKYDYGGCCPCGLYRECIPQCEHYTPPKKICTCGPHGYCSCEDDKPKKRKKKMDKDPGDFGFTMVGEEDILAPRVEDNRAEQLRDMIMPFLNNLKGNPNKDYIQWPGADRTKQIDAFIQKINKLVDG